MCFEDDWDTAPSIKHTQAAWVKSQLWKPVRLADRGHLLLPVETRSFCLSQILTSWPEYLRGITNTNVPVMTTYPWNTLNVEHDVRTVYDEITAIKNI